MDKFCALIDDQNQDRVWPSLVARSRGSSRKTTTPPERDYNLVAAVGNSGKSDFS